MNSSSFAHNLCFMNSIKVKVYTCPQSIDSTRHNYATYEPDLDEIKLLKSKGKSLVLLNYIGADEIYKKHLKETVKVNTNIIKKLELAGFELIQKINEDKFSFESPLYISKYRPNMYTLYVYK